MFSLSIHLSWGFFVIACFINATKGHSIGIHKRNTFFKVPQSEFNCTGRGDGFYPNLFNCSAYYVCDYSQAYHTECIPGMLFHPVSLFCEEAAGVHCASPTSSSTTAKTTVTQGTTQTTTPSKTTPPTTPKSTPTTPKLTTTTPKPTTTTTTPKPTTTTPKPTTTTPKPTTTTTPKPTTTTPKPTTTTPKPTTTTTTPKPTTTMKATFKPNCDGSAVYIRNPDDCTKYFECSNGIAYAKVCAPTLVYSPDINVCDYLTNVPICQK